MNLAGIATKLQTFGGPKLQVAAARVGHYSPQILTGVGILGGIAAGVLAARATLKLPSVVEEFEMGKDIISEKYGADIDDSGKTKDLVYLYGRTGLDLMKLYWQPITIGSASIICIIAAQGINQKRQVALVAAVKSAESLIQAYRARVIEAVGEEREQEIYYGVKTEKITDENGKTKTVKTFDPLDSTPYTRYFDPRNPNWQRGNRELNLFFLKNVQNWCNDRLNARGFLYLNEVYELLGVHESPEGQIIGWLVPQLGGEDGYVDFNIQNPVNQQIEKFRRGEEEGILLDFNHDGMILERLAKNAR
jgi:hypothetical protein